MVQCEECELWRLLYSKRKLSLADQLALEGRLENVTYTCGAQLHDLELDGALAEVYVRVIAMTPSKNCTILWGPTRQFASIVHPKLVCPLRTVTTHNAKIAANLARRARKVCVLCMYVCVCVVSIFVSSFLLVVYLECAKYS